MSSLLTLAAFFGCSLVASAQGETTILGSAGPRPTVLPSAPPADTGLRVRGLYFLIDQEPVAIYAHDPAAKVPVPGIQVRAKNYLNHETDILPVSGKQVIFTTSPDPVSAGNSGQRFAKATLPEGLKSVVFLFLPGTGKQGEDRARVMVVDDSQARFPTGSLKVINLSPTQVRLQLENANFDFNSGETRNIENPPVGPNQLSGMRSFAFQDNQWQRIGSGMWPHPGNKRVLQIVFQNPQSRQIEIRGVRDIAAVP